MPDATRSPVLIATDLTPNSEPALLRGRAHAEALGVPYLVVHVIPDVLRHHPLVPTPAENDASPMMDVTKKAAELLTEQVRRVLGASADDFRAIVEIGDAEDEIVRIAEQEHAGLIVVGAKPREGSERVLGHIAERVVRYSHATVLVARPGSASAKAVVATDFTDGSLPALAFAAMLVDKIGVEVTVVHAMVLPKANALSPVFSALGSPWAPPSAAAIEQLEGLGRTMLLNLAKEHRFAHAKQIEGEPASVILAEADAIDAEMIVVGTHGRTGLRRLLLGSTAEEIIRRSTRSVLVVRGAV
ncbi:MAG TPA: universal stress protein [Labilithrix sp.]|nr:universal stress protein [Labilithrix sp.]